MAYGTVKVDTIIFDNSGSDQNVTVSGLYRATTSGVTVTGTISGAVLVATTTVSGATVTGNIVQGTTMQGISGTFTSLTGTTTTGTTANFASGVFTTSVSGTTINGVTVAATTGSFTSLTGTTINGVTVAATTGSFTSLTGTTINGVTVAATTGSFTSLTGTTTSGTTANFVSGVFTTQVSGTTVTGTTSNFTSGNFATLSGATATFTSGVIALGTATNPSLSFVGDPNTGIYSPGADQLAVVTNGVERVEFGTGEVVFNDGGADVDLRVEGDTKANLLLVDAGADTVSIDGTQQLANQTPLRFGDSDNSHYVALRSPATVAANVTWDLPATDGTVDQVLKTNGSGVLGWSSGGAFASTSEVSGTHTTGTVTSGNASLTVASATGITSGMFIVGEGIAPGTTVSSIASTTVTMSANAGATLSSDPVAFYIANKSLSPGLVAGQLCRAWVNFNGTGTVAIRASYNVSSITDNNVGNYRVNFTTAMIDANYSVCLAVSGTTTLVTLSNTAPTISGFSIFTADSNMNFLDSSSVCASIFR